MAEILHAIGWDLLGIFGFVIGVTLLMFTGHLILGAIVWPIAYLLGPTRRKKINKWLDGPAPMSVEEMMWVEHFERTRIRDKSREARNQLIMGLILLVGCTVASRFGPDWLGPIVWLTAGVFLGIPLAICAIPKLISLRWDLAKMRRRYTATLPASGKVYLESVASRPRAR